MDGQFIGAQLKAARKLRGVKTRKALAALLGKPRFGEKVLGEIERNERPAQPHEVEWLAGGLELPASYFIETVSVAPASTEDALAEALVAITSQLTAQTGVLDDLRGVLVEVKSVLGEVKELLGKDTETAETIAEATRRVDEASRTLLARSVGKAGAGLRGGTRRRKPAAPKRATKRTPGASPQDPPAGQ